MTVKTEHGPMHLSPGAKDPLQRDGPVLPDDPNLTRMANLVRYMRKVPQYLPPNPWPECIACFCLSPDDKIISCYFLSIKRFEQFSEHVLFGVSPPETKIIFFLPTIKQPPAEYAQNVFRQMLSLPEEEVNGMFQYLATNRFFLMRDEVPTNQEGF